MNNCKQDPGQLHTDKKERGIKDKYNFLISKK